MTSGIYKRTNATKAKMSKSHTGLKHKKESIEKIRAWNLGRKRSKRKIKKGN